MKLWLIIAVAALVAAGTACGRDKRKQRERAAPPLQPKRPPDAAPGPPPVAFGEQCTTVGGAACRRLASCSGIGAGECLEVLVTQCCPDGRDSGNCLAPSPYSRKRIEQCARALGRQPCNDRKANVVPADCDGLLAP